MKIQTRLANAGLGLALRSLFRPHYSPSFMRKSFDLLAGVGKKNLSAKYPSLKIQSLTHEMLPMEFLTTSKGSSKTLLFMHGGGYFMGSIYGYRRNAMRLAYRTRSQVVTFDYRLSPEHPFPAALEDAKKAYLFLRKTLPAEKIVFGGDSAGGGLTLATLIHLIDEGIELPSRAFVISPWTDLTGESPTIETNKNKDVWLSKAHYGAWAPWYSPNRDYKNPLISPLFANLQGLPKLLFLVGDQETLLGDSENFHNKALKAGVDSTLVKGKDMQHDWMFSLPFLKESRDAMNIIGDFVQG